MFRLPDGFLGRCFFQALRFSGVMGGSAYRAGLSLDERFRHDACLTCFKSFPERLLLQLLCFCFPGCAQIFLLCGLQSVFIRCQSGNLFLQCFQLFQPFPGFFRFLPECQESLPAFFQRGFFLPQGFQAFLLFLADPLSLRQPFLIMLPIILQLYNLPSAFFPGFVDRLFCLQPGTDALFFLQLGYPAENIGQELSQPFLCRNHLAQLRFGICFFCHQLLPLSFLFQGHCQRPCLLIFRLGFFFRLLHPDLILPG